VALLHDPAVNVEDTRQATILATVQSGDCDLFHIGKFLVDIIKIIWPSDILRAACSGVTGNQDPRRRQSPPRQRHRWGEVYRQIQPWHQQYGERWAPGGLLGRLADTGTTFREAKPGKPM
jgi:hypothetical protein